MEDNKIFKLTEEDFLGVMQDMDITDEKLKEYIINRAYETFHIYDWYEITSIFIQQTKDEFEVRKGK